MAEPNKIDNKVEVNPSEKDTRKPLEGEELSQAEQEKVSGGFALRPE
jgi:hypothetical protein